RGLQQRRKSEHTGRDNAIRQLRKKLELDCFSSRFPKQVGFCLHQEPADPYEASKLIQVGRHYLFDVCFFCAEWKIAREALHETRVNL
ncbi:hypothetical protein MUP77_13550, partial [Candidatus Bathyarchaeota archaeon]|nr:hypothetical protein [Candidatus Bathyarchaeota archaeon]